jgi:hypothetical protein
VVTLSRNGCVMVATMVDRLSQDMFAVVCDDLEGGEGVGGKISIADFCKEWIQLTPEELNEVKVTHDMSVIISFLSRVKTYCREMGVILSDEELIQSASSAEMKELWKTALFEMRSDEGELIL